MLTSSLVNIGIVDAAVVALLGWAVVFFGLILLMGVIITMGKFFIAKDKKAAAKATAAVSAAPAAAPVAAAPVAAAAPASNIVGTTGELKLRGVDDQTAAILMAIISDTTKIPLNQLRFKRIVRVDSDK